MAIVGFLSATALSFCKWGFLILTAVTFAAAEFLLSKLKALRFRRKINMVRHISVVDDDDASVSSSDSDDDDEGETEEEGESEEEKEEEEEEYESRGFMGKAKMSGAGNFAFSSFSLADLVGGMGVVKSWEGTGLGLERGRESISFFDASRGELLSTFHGGAAETMGFDHVWPAEFVSAADEAGRAVVKVWDAREKAEKPAGTALPLLRRRIAGIRAREEKVLVGDEGGDFAAVDLRKLAQVEDWEDSGSSWWRSAAACLKLLSPRLENA